MVREASQRTAEKEDRVVADLRQRIVDGQLRPGERLPTRIDLAKRYDISNQTLQQVMERLRRDGFIETRGKGGTLVAERPPHLFRYGFVTGSGPQDAAHWPSHYFQRFMFEEAMAMNQAGEAWIVPYTMVDWHIDTDAFVRLMDDIKRRCLAGLIFDAPTFLVNTPLGALLDEPNLPAVTICQGTNHTNLSAVDTNALAVIDLALDHFVATGRRRVALLASGLAIGYFNRFADAAAARGLETRSAWLQYMVPDGAGGAAALCELLMEARERPDALLIADDCLVEPASRGLAAAGVISDHDLAVVAHANFPRLPKTHVPVRWLGFDIPEIVQTCLHVLRERRAGRQMPLVTTIQPHWQESGARSGPGNGRHGLTRTDTD